MSKKSAFRKANDEVIKKAFVRLMASKDESIKAAMYGMLEDAVIVALEMHDERHPGHVEIGDTYGWMLVHNHRIQEIMVVSTDANRGEATDLLMWLSSSSTSSSGEYISDNGWSHQKSAKQVVDRAGLVKRAQELYAKWNSDKAKTAVGNKVTFKSIY